MKNIFKDFLSQCARPEQLKDMLERAGFSDVEVFRKKPSYATIKGILKCKTT